MRHHDNSLDILRHAQGDVGDKFRRLPSSVAEYQNGLILEMHPVSKYSDVTGE